MSDQKIKINKKIASLYTWKFYLFIFLNNDNLLTLYPYSECSNSSPSRSRMFIVFEEQLLELLNSCPKCSSVAMVQLKQTVGSMVRFQQDCRICGYNRLWQSQLMTGAVPAGNLLMSAGNSIFRYVINQVCTVKPVFKGHP